MFDIFKDSLYSAFIMIFSGDPELWGIVLLSLRCTFQACLLAALIGIPFALFMINRDFPGKRLLLTVFNSLMALPTVVVGLFLYVFISRRGIFGPLDLLYSPAAISIGQFILILPLVVMFAYSALHRLDRRYREAALTLGASAGQAALAVMREARFAMVATLCAAYGRGIAEVGVSMMLGGNIKGFTRTMTTAMALEYDKGEFTLALGLGVVLLLLSFLLNAGIGFFQGRAEA
ncbi:MAG: ABC transporter permease [Deltaproteobacteria bacterium]|jgi:tungstate transport system permease protein|nr:ABC transporter permease [Deltaproteobacteria bacterium]